MCVDKQGFPLDKFGNKTECPLIVSCPYSINTSLDEFCTIVRVSQVGIYFRDFGFEFAKIKTWVNDLKK
ncbi:MAG: hypothetical protein MUO82_10725 [Candidatus Thermoplasmatota archaeon]|nr:hypothetical protein [Candidatus Thermoplasmatota archaeon]